MVFACFAYWPNALKAMHNPFYNTTPLDNKALYEEGRLWGPWNRIGLMVFGNKYVTFLSAFLLGSLWALTFGPKKATLCFSF